MILSYSVMESVVEVRLIMSACVIVSEFVVAVAGVWFWSLVSLLLLRRCR